MIIYGLTWYSLTDGRIDRKIDYYMAPDIYICHTANKIVRISLVV